MVEVGMIKWINNHKLESAFLAVLLILTLFLRFYRLPEYMTFLGDEGRDALVVKKILTQYDFPLLGPTMSVGNIYLGPLYYYMMSVSMLFFWLNPVAAAGMVALIGTFTVFLIYFLTKEWFGKAGAFVAAFLYSISSVNVIYSRSSWNPNPAPFFALLAVLGLFKAHSTGNFRWFILTGASLAFAVQMHYLAMILLPIFGLLWVSELRTYLNSPKERLHFIPSTILSVLVFIFLISPLIIFDLKYNFMNYRAFKEIFFSAHSAVGVSQNSLPDIYTNLFVGRYLAGGNLYLAVIFSVLILVPLLYVVWNKFINKKVLQWPYLALGTWLFIGLLGLSLVKENIYDHYFGFLNPSIFILFGAFVEIVLRIKNGLPGKLILGLIVALVVISAYLNIAKNPLKNNPGRQLQRTQDTAKFVIDQANNRPFNFALIAKNNYDSAYLFYLDVYGHKAKQIPFDVTDQLFVVCEDQVCQPINNDKFEISGFGMAKIEWEKEFNGLRVFKLVHTSSK